MYKILLFLSIIQLHATTAVVRDFTVELPDRWEFVKGDEDSYGFYKTYQIEGEDPYITFQHMRFHEGDTLDTVEKGVTHLFAAMKEPDLQEHLQHRIIESERIFLNGIEMHVFTLLIMRRASCTQWRQKVYFFRCGEDMYQLLFSSPVDKYEEVELDFNLVINTLQQQ